MKDCNVPDDCWECIEYNNCRVIEEYKETHKLPILPMIIMAGFVSTTIFGIAWIISKWIKIISTSLPF